MAAEIGRVPSDPELAHYMKISVDKLRKINDKARSVVSLESPLRMGTNHKAEMDQRTIGDFIASDAPTPEDDFQQRSLQRDIRAVINELAEREREVLILRFGLDNGESMSTSQTAMRLGITIDRVRYVEARALNKLRSPQRNYRLKDYLGGGHHNIAEKKQEQLLTSSPMMTKSNSNRRRNQDQNQKQPSAQEKFWFF
jgi:RNA polymerase primary sigma factor